MILVSAKTFKMIFIYFNKGITQSPKELCCIPKAEFFR
jgi:hypothetical protein